MKLGFRAFGPSGCKPLVGSVEPEVGFLKSWVLRYPTRAMWSYQGTFWDYSHKAALTLLRVPKKGPQFSELTL